MKVNRPCIAERQFHRLPNAVSGHCEVCSSFGLHDFFDRDLHGLVCFDCSLETAMADELARILMCREVIPLRKDVLDDAVKLFSRGRPLII